jgi:hypothetical protein
MITEMWMVPVELAVVLAIGAVGGWSIGRFAPGGWARRSLLALWVLAPFLCLIAVTALDPLCNSGGDDLGNQLSCGESVAFIAIMFIGFGPPWALSILAGVCVAWRGRD